jgi:hypothetical protein
MADILRACLLNKRPSKRPLLYFYDAKSKDWHVNLSEYPTLQVALFWMRYEQITLSEWRQASNEVCNNRATSGQ